MRRRSWKTEGAEGLIVIEAEQHADGHIEVAELDHKGDQTGPIHFAEDWDTAFEKAGDMSRLAIVERTV